MLANEKTLSVNQRSKPAPQRETLQNALQQAYEDLGRAYYTYRFEEPVPELIEYFNRITTLKNQIAAGTVPTCPACGNPLSQGARFCGVCGAKIS